MLSKKINSVLVIRVLSIVALVSTLALGITGTAFATLSDGSTFDASNGSLDSATYKDWNNPIEPITCPATAPGSGINCGLDLSGSSLDNAFGQGTKEDSPVPTIVSGSIPPNKSDLTRFYVNKEFVNGKFFLYLAWERSNVLGNANMDFEINQVRTPSSNGVTPIRTAGDLLITFDFTNGGGNPVLGMLTWVTSGSTSQCFASNSLPCWGNHASISATGEAEGSVNTTTVFDKYIPGNIPALTFGEAAVDLTDAGIFSNKVCTHLGSVYLKSRSSSSFTSEVKDFVAPINIDISNCGQIIIHKATVPSPDPTNTGFVYNTTGGLTPSTFKLYVNDVPAARVQDYGSTVFAGSYSVTETDPGPTFVLQNLDCSASSLTNGSTATVVGGTVSIVLKADDTIDCTYTNQLQEGAIKISKTTTKGDAPLAGATFSITGAGGPYSLTTGSDGTVCKDGLLFGSYSVQEQSAPAGYQVNDTSVHTVSVGTNATCGSGNELPLSFSDTPLSRITVSFKSLAGLGVTTATIDCTGDSGAAPLPESPSKVLDNLVPGTYSCTVVIDP